MKPSSTDPQSKPATGRPSTYRAEYAAVARKLCLLGATDHDLAEAFDKGEATIRRWKIEHADFAAACEVGKAEADSRVEQSLYNRAVGYSYKSEKIFCNKDGDVTRVEYVAHVPPDVVAQIFWLKNRKPAQWRDKLEIDANLKPADVSANPLPPDEWDRQYGSRAN